MSIKNGYATITEYKAFADITSTSATDDGVIESLIEAASRYIDTQTGRTFYPRLAETRYFSIPESYDPLLMLDDDLLSIDANGFVNGDGTAIGSTDYILLPRNLSPKYAIKLKDITDTTWETDTDNSAEYVIAVTGTWGYSQSRPDDINVACLMIAASLYKRRFGENLSAISTVTAAGVVITPQDIPAAAQIIVKGYTRASL